MAKKSSSALVLAMVVLYRLGLSGSNEPLSHLSLSFLFLFSVKRFEPEPGVVPRPAFEQRPIL
jgi:hypothetical protein